MKYLKTFENHREMNPNDLEVGETYLLDNEDQNIKVEYLGLKKDNPDLRNKVKVSFGKNPNHIFKWIGTENFLVMGNKYLQSRLSIEN